MKARCRDSAVILNCSASIFAHLDFRFTVTGNGTDFCFPHHKGRLLPKLVRRLFGKRPCRVVWTVCSGVGGMLGRTVPMLGRTVPLNMWRVQPLACALRRMLSVTDVVSTGALTVGCFQRRTPPEAVEPCLVITRGC